MGLPLLVLLAGCPSLPPLGPVQPPPHYPQRKEPEEAFATFLWAWHQGDLKVLQSTLAAWPLHDFEKKLKDAGEAETSAWYRQDAQDLRLIELEWVQRGDSLAYLRVALASSTIPRIELDFSLLRRPDGWAVSGKRLIR